MPVLLVLLPSDMSATRCRLRGGVCYIVVMFLATAWLLSVATPSHAHVLRQGASPVQLGKDLNYIEDPEGRLDIETIQQQGRWQVNDSSSFSKGYRASAWWFRVDVLRQSDSKDWLLEVAYPLLDRVDVYLVQDGRVVQQHKLGDILPFTSRQHPHRYFLAPLSLPYGEQVQLFIRVQTSGSANVPMSIWEEKTFYAHDAVKNTGQGMYFGALLIIAAYNLLMYLVLGERVYLYYVVYVIATAFVVASIDGWAFQYLWPTHPFLNDYGVFMSIVAACTFALMFTRIFLDIRQLSPSLHRLVSLAITTAVIFAIAALVLPYATMIRFLAPLAGLCCLLATGCAFYALVRRQPAAKYYTLAWLMVLSGGFALALGNIGWLPMNGLTSNALQIGSLVEVLLLSFALAERINQERTLRLAAQQDAFALQVKVNADLEERVKERTLELEAANRQLEELSNTDQLTGLKNRRCLDSYLALEFSRAARHRHSIAIILIDADNFKRVNDVHGHLVGDDCLKEIAARTGAQACRPSDLAARYGGEEFCIVLPETEEAGAAIVAERIRRSIEAAPASTRVGPLAITVSIGVCAKVPEAATDCARFLEWADAALYRSKEAGRNRFTMA